MFWYWLLACYVQPATSMRINLRLTQQPSIIADANDNAIFNPYLSEEIV